MTAATTQSPDDVILSHSPPPSFTTFKTDVTMKVPNHLVEHLMNSFRIYGKFNGAKTMRSFGGMNRGNFNRDGRDHVSREIRGVVRENSRGEKLVSFSCSSVNKAGHYDVFVHLYDSEESIYIQSFVMNWPNIELRSIESMNTFHIIIIENDPNKGFCCPATSSVHLALQIYYVGPHPRFQGELKSSSILVHIEQISRKFNIAKSIHNLSTCIFHKPGIYSIRLVSSNPKIILNSTEHSVSYSPPVQMKSTPIGGCHGHLMISINNNITCARDTDRIRMMTITRSKFKHNEIYLAEQKIKDGQSHFDCALLDDDGDDDDREVCWEYVSVGVDGSVNVRGRHCEALNQSKTSLIDSSQSGWSECVNEGVKVKKEKCFMKRTCQAVQFVACRKTQQEFYNNNYNNDYNTNYNLFKPASSDINRHHPTTDSNETSECIPTSTKHNDTIISSCACNHESRHIVRIEQRIILLTFTFVNRRSRIIVRDGSHPSSDVLFDSWHGNISVHQNVTSRTGVVSIETHSPPCEGVAFEASYVTMERDRIEKEDEEVGRRKGDKILFACLLGSILSMMLLLVFSTFRKNRIQ